MDHHGEVVNVVSMSVEDDSARFCPDSSSEGDDDEQVGAGKMP